MVDENIDDIFNEKDDSKTAFNSALDIIQRISRLEYSLTACLLNEDLVGAYKLLVLIHTEIDFKLEEGDRDKLDGIEKEIYEKLKTAIEIRNFEGRVYIKNPEIREQLIMDLIELKKKISRMKYKVGLGMIDMSDPRYALLNG